MDDTFTLSDLRHVHWLGTIKLALVRGFFAGIIILIIQTIWPAGMEPRTTTEFITFPLFWAVGAVPFALFVQGVGWAIGAAVPLFGVFTGWLGSLMVCLGDPIVYLINRFFPSLLGVADLHFINFQPIIFITQPE